MEIPEAEEIANEIRESQEENSEELERLKNDEKAAKKAWSEGRGSIDDFKEATLRLKSKQLGIHYQAYLDSLVKANDFATSDIQSARDKIFQSISSAPPEISSIYKNKLGSMYENVKDLPRFLYERPFGTADPVFGNKYYTPIEKIFSNLSDYKPNSPLAQEISEQKSANKNMKSLFDTLEKTNKVIPQQIEDAISKEVLSVTGEDNMNDFSDKYRSASPEEKNVIEENVIKRLSDKFGAEKGFSYAQFLFNILKIGGIFSLVAFLGLPALCDLGKANSGCVVISPDGKTYPTNITSNKTVTCSLDGKNCPKDKKCCQGCDFGGVGCTIANVNENACVDTYCCNCKYDSRANSDMSKPICDLRDPKKGWKYDYVCKSGLDVIIGFINQTVKVLTPPNISNAVQYILFVLGGLLGIYLLFKIIQYMFIKIEQE